MENNRKQGGSCIPPGAYSTIPHHYDERGNSYQRKCENESNNFCTTSSEDFHPMTSEELENQKKNRKKELIVGAIGDGISAFANLFFTTKGAPSAYKSNNRGKKSSYPSLMERIYGRHKDEDAVYNQRKTEWEKEQEKSEQEFQKRKKAAENEARENARAEIHEKFSPKEKNWDDDGYVDYIFQVFKRHIDDNTSRTNEYEDSVELNNGFGPTIRPGEKYPNDSKVMKYINSFNLKDKGKKYIKQLIMSTILSGTETFDLSEGFLDQLREELMDEDNNFVK